MSEIQFEGRLKAIGATSTKDGNWTKVEFQVHPDDDVSAMLRAGLNSRWLVVVEAERVSRLGSRAPAGG